MTSKKIMLIAGEASGDALGAELVAALRNSIGGSQQADALTFFGAGGPKLAAAGVELATDMTQHAAIGFGDVIKKYGQFRKIFNELVALAIERKPDAIILVDFGAFNLRFASAVRSYVAKNKRKVSGWTPKIVQFVSPQVWASRPYRARTLEENVDLLLCLFPF
jgi:lipid-A-disaccharide synthase